MSEPTLAQLMAQQQEIVSNVMLMRQEFMRHLIDPKRDIDKECGYPVNPTINDYKTLYDREGISTRVVDIYPDESWKMTPEVVEKEDGDYTPWEEAWKKLAKEFKLYKLMMTADQISGVGTYGIILLGINDGKPLNTAVEGIDLRTGKKKEDSSAKYNLLYARPFDESVLSITRFETDKNSPRFGQPMEYQINLAQDAQTSAAVGSATAQSPEIQTLSVHWTRVIHLADNRKNSIVFGVPRMKDVFNRLYDLRKVLGGAPEMFWKGGFPGIAFEAMPGAQGAELSKEDKKKLRDEFEAYQNGLQRYLALIGMSAKSLAPQVADPTSAFETCVKAICIAKGIPYRIFMGTEEAQLAGEQDKKAWNDRLKKRQVDYITPEIICPLVDRLMAYGVLEYVESYEVVWPDLHTPSDKDKADVAVANTTALAQYIAGNVDAIIPPLEYLTHVLGYDTDRAMAILENANLADDGTLDREDMMPEPEAGSEGTTKPKEKKTKQPAKR